MLAHAPKPPGPGSGQGQPAIVHPSTGVAVVHLAYTTLPNGSVEPLEKERLRLETGTTVAKYVIFGEEGHGNSGGTVYLAKDARKDCKVSNKEVALKYPVMNDEVEFFSGIAQKAPQGCIGVPRVIEMGRHAGENYMAMEILGHPLTDVFKAYRRETLASKWRAMSTVGRLLLRRLEALHRLGFVHNDVNPGNVLIGRQRGDAMAKAAPYLIDFGCARRFPNGNPSMQATWGSVDFCSIRCAQGGPRGPTDDCESLGWMLLHGLFGELPWFHWTRTNWHCSMGRMKITQHVKDAKLNLIEQGWDCLAIDLSDIPDDLDQYLHKCYEDSLAIRSQYEIDALPNYSALFQLLGADAKAPAVKAEKDDLTIYTTHIAPIVAKYRKNRPRTPSPPKNCLGISNT